MKKKKNSPFRYLNPKNIRQDVHRYGQDVSTGSYLKYLLICYVGLVIFAIALKLKMPYILFIVLVTSLFLPNIFMIQFKTAYEQKKFEDVNAYLEQLLYSFKRQPKILASLKDTAMLFEENKDSEMYVAIQKAIEYIEIGIAEDDLYKEAFAIIEENLGCKRMYRVHNFLRQVESNGGLCETSIDILLNDRNLWVDRITALIQEKRRIKINVTIAIGLSFVITLMSLYMLPDDFGITDMFASQIATTAVVLLNGCIWYVVQQLLSGSLLAADGDIPFDQISRQYNLVMHGDIKKKQKKFTATAIITVIGAIVAGIFLNVKIAVIIALFAYLLYTQPKRQYKSCRKKIIKEVEKTFPDWMMSLSLQMQTTYNVHVSIMKTIKDAAPILQEELIRLEDELEKYPNSLDPYIGFFKKLHISEVASSMKMLYAMAEFGAEDAQEQIQAVVNRNTTIMDKAEKMRMEDELAGISVAMLAPMLTGVLKMVVDLVLVMTYVLSVVNTI